jgi:hypothetical protein
MNRALAPAVVPALLLGALATLAGCGSATGSRAADAGATDPTGAPTSATASPTVVATTAAPEPTWPATGCESHVMSSIDYARAPKGWKTPEEAVAHAADSGIPSGAVVVAPAGPGDPITAWVVDDSGATILATVTFASSGSGLYVDSVERCA